MKKLIVFALLCCSVLLYGQYYYREYYKTQPISYSEWTYVELPISINDSSIIINTINYSFDKVLRNISDSTGNFVKIKFYKDEYKGYVSFRSENDTIKAINIEFQDTLKVYKYK